MPISYHHVDELSSPPTNLICIDKKSVLASTTVSLASQYPGEVVFLRDLVAGLVPSGSRPSTAETFLPSTPREDAGPGGAAAPKPPPRRVALCALPDECSRHNSPAQPHAIADCIRAISGSGSVAVVMCLDDPTHAFAAGCAVARAFPLYSSTSRKRPGAGAASVPAPPPSRDVRVYLRVPRDAWPAVRVDLSSAAEGIQLAARLVDTPPNVLSTTAFVEEALAVARGLSPSVQVKVIRGDDLRAQGFGGIYGVGKAAVEPPALVVLSYLASGAATADGALIEEGGGASSGPGSVCFVGKGIIYDTGGLSIKTKTGMPGMKRDMGGAAAILAAFQAAVKAQMAAAAAGGSAGRSRPLHALLCLAENSVAANATRPDDVHTLYSGRTVEINNTDAEGRLVLSDGVAYAARHLSPAVIVDMATLTGAQGVTTGRRHAAVLSNDEGLERTVVECGRLSGDLAHPVVYCPEFFTEEFRSSVADMKNSVADRSNAQVSCAGQFIANHMEQFVAGPSAGGGRWLHIDMASPAHQGERATGYGVALLFKLLRALNQDSAL
eukprot:g6500.t1